MKSLRSFLTDAEAALGPVRHVEKKVAPDRELAAISKLLETRGNPILFFSDVDGSTLPVVTGVHATRERIAFALGVPVAAALDHFIECLADGVPARVLDDAPVKEVRQSGDEVDLGTLPIPIHADRDSGQFLTAAVGIVKDARHQTVNTGIYRMMVLDRNRLTVATGTDLGAIIAEAHAEGHPVDFAAVIGHHPAFQISSQAKISRTIDSLAVAGALLGEPLALVAADTVSLEVPAAAEIVLEGQFRPGQTLPDGPFGESPRYYEASWGYVLEVSAITRRSDAMFLDINNVHLEHTCLSIFPAREAQLLTVLRAVYPQVSTVRIPLRTAGMHAHIKVDPSRDGEAKQILMMALGAIPRLKHVVAVNSDVDITVDEEVLWALATRFQADRDLLVVPYVSGTSMDPSSYSLDSRATVGEMRTQVAFDATIPVGRPFRERADAVAPRFASCEPETLLVPADEVRPAPWRARAQAQGAAG